MKTPAGFEFAPKARLSQTLTKQSSDPVYRIFELSLFAQQTELISSSCASPTTVLTLLVSISYIKIYPPLEPPRTSLLSPENLIDIKEAPP